jgi:hypothetical protein
MAEFWHRECENHMGWMKLNNEKTLSQLIKTGKGILKKENKKK